MFHTAIVIAVASFEISSRIMPTNIGATICVVRSIARNAEFTSEMKMNNNNNINNNDTVATNYN